MGLYRKYHNIGNNDFVGILAAVRKRHSNVTDEAIKKSVSLFLATAKSRLENKDALRDETEGLEELSEDFHHQ